MEPFVSIVIPAYNAARFISETLDSVLQQSYSSFEIIVVNDGSTDSTKEIVEKKILTDKRISIIDQKNHGVSVARNNGIKKAKGDFLAFLDADDTWLKDNLKEKIMLLTSDPTVDFVFSDLNLIDENSRNIGSGPTGNDVTIFEGTLLWDHDFIPSPCSNILFRRSCLNENILFPAELSNIADKYFVVQLSHYFRGKHIGKALLNYRQVSGSMSKNIMLHETDTITAYNLYKKSGYFKNTSFRRRCFSNMYLIIGASWWKDGGNKLRALYFILRAFFTAPLNTLSKVGQKIFTTNN
ncbi:MAG TPA: glycosyltransferase [Bacteroidia bacterium]|jgi:glycosyltransferase involved in cell wall biosynthesis|nr:glycosyltransferase [Bacteroidia bacterium]